MSLSPEDIAHHQTLLDFYEKEKAKHTEIARIAVIKLRDYENAIQNTRAILRAEGVDI